MARKAESTTFEYDRNLRQFVMGKLAYVGMNKKELAERMGISLAALNYKLKDPNGKLTLAESHDPADFQGHRRRKEVVRMKSNLQIGISLIQKELHRMETALAKGRVNEADKGQVLEKIHGLKAVLAAVQAERFADKRYIELCKEAYQKMADDEQGGQHENT